MRTRADELAKRAEHWEPWHMQSASTKAAY